MPTFSIHVFVTSTNILLTRLALSDICSDLIQSFCFSYLNKTEVTLEANYKLVVLCFRRNCEKIIMSWNSWYTHVCMSCGWPQEPGGLLIFIGEIFQGATKVQLGQREGFSKRDIQKIRKMYKCNKRRRSSYWLPETWSTRTWRFLTDFHWNVAKRIVNLVLYN